MQCPACYEPGTYSTYSNGAVKTGYCINCAYETSVPTKEVTKIPMIDVARPKPKKQDKGRRR